MKKLLSVFMMVALLLTSLSPALLVTAAGDSTGGNNYDDFTVYMDNVSIYEGAEKASVGLYWAGNTAENNPKDVAAAQMFIYYPKALTFTGFAVSDALAEDGWLNTDERALTASDVSKVIGAQETFEACGVEIATGETSDYKFVSLIMDAMDNRGNLTNPAFYNGLLGTLQFDISADASAEDVYAVNIASEPLLFNGVDAKTFTSANFVNGSVSVLGKPVTTVSAENATGKTGGEVTVPVKLDGNEGIFIARMSLEYDHEVFSVKEITAGDVFADPNHFLSSVDANGNITLYFEAGAKADLTATGTLAYVTFTVANADKYAGDYAVTPVCTQVVNFNEESITPVVNAGTVTVEVSDTMKIEAAEVSAPRFQEVSVPVSIGRNTEGLWAIRAEFKYDQSALTFKGVEDGMLSVADAYSEKDGVITVFIEKESMQNVTETEGVLYTLKFDTLVEGVTPIDLSVQQVINLDEQKVDFLSINGSVTVTPCEHIHDTYTKVTQKPTMHEEGVLSTLCKDCDAVIGTEPIAKVPGLSPQKAEALAGKQVKVPVNVLNNPGLVAVGAEFTYNTSELKFVGLESGMFTADQFSVSDKDGVVTVYVESPAPTNLTEDGTAFYLVFEIPEGAAALTEYTFTGAPVERRNVNEAEEIVYMEVDGGVVKVSCPHTGDRTEEKVAPDCENPGKIIVTCSVCKEVIEEKVDPEHPDALGHQEGEGVATKEATCTETGVMTYSCVRCGKELRTEDIDMIPHTEGAGVVTKEATCTEAGEITYSCEVCETILRTEEIAKLAHTEGAGVVTKEATCTEAGTMTYSCTVCGEVLRTEEIAKLAHAENAGVVTKEATCTEAGEMTYSCTVCGEVLRTEPIAKLAHTENAGVVTKEATCTEAGTMTYSCTVCGEVLRTEEIAKLAHTEGAGVVTKEATCAEEGEMTYSCTVCGEVIRTEKIEKIDHTLGEWVIEKEATETEDGLRTQSCTVCGTVVNSEVIPATGSGADTTDDANKPDDSSSTDDTTAKSPADSTTASGTNGTKNPPKTGDYMVYIIIVAAVAVVGCVAVIVIRKKKASDK
ncbi:MAG: hypothetical protein HFE65_03145 [Clostridiales bacterium]|nr:hypothetical protein [Clostridiales bacterium]